ncbi:MAG TPA: nucleoside monophosphate kinase, partial [Candidatus Sumerlaeia bacterium]|nr:nucleoside monophosphate kinase [Candidatus Sumerlaeia bacterium]
MNIVMIGVQGAGKGTQSKMLSEKLGIPHISTGDIFRDNIKNQTPLGKEARKYIDRGALVPDAVVINMALSRINQPDA